jgi:multidrug efflux system membrane fusion protein
VFIPPNRRQKMGLPRIFMTLAFLLAFTALLAGCGEPAPKVEDIRPVRVMKLANGNADVMAEFPGEVRARIESRLGFRVGGKIVARKVEIGSSVRRGQILMQLDPQDLQLVQAQADAALKAADSNLVLAKAELQRYRDLRATNFVSHAALDAKEAAYKAALSTHEQALAAYRTQTNQAGYAVLAADIDGVVTSVDGEVGQVVAAGTPVVRVAQTDEKEVVIAVPENKVESLRRIKNVTVKVWALPEAVFAGKIRELSPIADPATRTYTAKITIPDAPPEVRLGMTAYVSFSDRTPNAMIRVPLSALFQDKAATAVWVVENGIATPVPVRVAGPAGNDILLAGGVSPGQIIVTAGVNLLKPGQKVKVLGDDSTTGEERQAPADTGAAK